MNSRLILFTATCVALVCLSEGAKKRPLEYIWQESKERLQSEQGPCVAFKDEEGRFVNNDCCSDDDGWRCGLGDGDCDSDDQCMDGLVCSSDCISYQQALGPEINRRMSDTVTHAKYAKMEFSGSDQCCILPDKRRSEWLEWLSEGYGRTRINTVQLHPKVASQTRI